ncbi:MAG: Gfo/Idh/MocA family oxidoreductase [Clostridium sp.]|jgi:predicted dehydrogenase|uniref:Gfo/Idh/MocA family protein n=1 Tax=Clostridium sp. TaxID=1506 RepID=UPI0025C397CF|nr:Gfo/Idh/MocA family oxidoreductase [Clostridium sp.]MCH3964801.1 Gfo/Idh/MocA family oxidoreductase [Clostridium sp.]MCI1715272.1 Gfo/Idh/MocA family oxidoreductase [Clostridium sp.]MCI1799534.1 Gfo/Idh/MocA family oxidoreductase [Clostridium sp.]MCI1813455.1 Gfo/Idh/MocA family oxidoreductase [Clostridium sp.]MCI1870346.1 Gfo/Idh/MocA family oxidoreductase [Clostridium sp.]
MKQIKIGIIGGGWMGTTHARAYNNVRQHYGLDVVPILELIVDTCEEQAERVCRQYGFNRWSTEVKDIFNDPSIDLIVITTPNKYHVPLLIEAAKTGKAIFCEKPMGMNAGEAKKALDAVNRYNNITMCGFIYINNPMVVYARELMESGKLGKVISFRGEYDMDYCAGKDIPHTWRQYDAVSGALGDIGAHMLSISNFLVGEIDEVCAKTQIVYKQRKKSKDSNEMLPVENDDEVNAIYTFKNGCLGTLVSSRVAPGNKVGERFEVQLTKGAIRFDQERMNELEVYDHSAPPENQGFKLIRAMPLHGEYGIFCTQAGLGISYIDLMTIQAHKMLKAVSENKKIRPDVEDAYKINVLIDAMLKSDREHRWVKVSECE